VHVIRRLLAIALCALLAGCGFGGGRDPEPTTPPPPAGSGAGSEPVKPASEIADPRPTKAAVDARPDARLRARLNAGEVALVDLTGHIGIRPRALTFAKGGRMEGLEWTRWNDRGAEATGRMVGVVCNPDCARGVQITAPATITLSRPVACPKGRFFDRGRIEVASDDPHAASTSWLAAPC
jgi:hypothetical protein